MDAVRMDEWKAVAAAERQPVRSLTCCVCGEATRGRPWWNRDDGYGICGKCVTFVQRHRPFGRDPIDATEFRRLYGIHGVHYNVNEGRK